MKIALVYPPIAIEGFSNPASRPRTGWIQHGLCYISSALKERGHTVSLIDLRQISGWGELSYIIKRISPQVVGISSMSVDYDAAVKSANIIKREDKNIKIIVGGAHPSLAEGEFIDNADIDYIFKGEAELTLPDIIDDISRGALKTRVITGSMPDLDKIPFVDRSLFGILENPIAPFLKMPFITAIAGRGCTYNCNFCQPAERQMFGSRLRRMSPERFVDELDAARFKFGLNSLMIHDDCLVEDKKWVERFLMLYEKKKFRKSFVCQARADIIAKNPELFKDMRKRGLDMLLVGFESGNQRILNFLRKGTTVEHNYAAADICKRLGIRVWANFMLGIPTETKEEAMDTIRMIEKIKPYVSSPAFYTPHPGSDLFDFCVKNDLSLIKRHEDYRRDPNGRKIRGVDYDFLKKALGETAKAPFWLRLKRKMDKWKVRRFNKKFIAKHEI